MDISIILATYKRTAILAKTLESFCQLGSDSINWEILVVDNDRDQSAKELVATFKDRLPVKYVGQSIQGKNRAINLGISFAQGDLIILTDDDVLADKNWIKEIYNGAKRWPEFNVFGGRILPHWPQEFSPLKDIDGNFLYQAYGIADWRQDEGPYEAFKVWGPNMMVRKKIFDQGWRFSEAVGPDGNSYVMGSETEFTKRLERAGIKSVYLPKALVYHQIREEQMSRQWMYGRAFRQGRAQRYYKSTLDVAMLFGAPRYMYRQLAKVFVQRLLAAFSLDKTKQINLGVQYWALKGNIHQYRRGEFVDNQREKNHTDNKPVKVSS